ncbi:Protein Hook 1, partial [Goodea atripinnis]
VCATSRLEAAKDDYRIHCEELEKQLIELQHRNDELTSLAEESRALKDELDVLRNCSDRVVMLEASVETYKRKLENLGDLKRQVKLLEENNMTYMQNSVSLEEELRKANAARAQLELSREQISELQQQVEDLQKALQSQAAKPDDVRLPTCTKLAIESRLGGRTDSMFSPGQSFLMQQRHVSNAPRRAASISMPATTSN